jgi:hypothetical protein
MARALQMHAACRRSASLPLACQLQGAPAFSLSKIKGLRIVKILPRSWYDVHVAFSLEKQRERACPFVTSLYKRKDPLQT